MTALVVSVMAVFTVLFEQNQYQAQLAEMLDSQNVLTSGQALIISETLAGALDDSERMHLTLSGILANPQIVGAEITDNSSQRLISFGKVDNSAGLFQAKQDIVTVVGDETEILGQLATYSSDRRILENIRSRTHYVLGLFFFLICITIIVISASVRLIIEKPISLLVDGFKTQPGKKPSPVVWKKMDEMGYLVAEFNKLNAKVYDVVDGLRSELHESEIRESERIRSFADATIECLLIHLDGEIVDVNEAFTQLLGYEKQAIVGLRVEEILETSSSENSAIEKHILQETIIIDANENSINIEWLEKDILYLGKEAKVIAIRDITDRLRAEEEIRFLAHNDSLTKLPNRVQFYTGLTKGFELAERTGIAMTVMYLDLDKFKSVNDKHGHDAGDELLMQVAARIKSTVRKVDTAARLGGDEFAIVQLEKSSAVSPEKLAERILKNISRPYMLKCGVVEIGASIGMASTRDGFFQIEQLLKNADLALYNAKESGRGKICAYSDKLAAELRRDQKLEEKLREAILEKRIDVMFQPQMNLKSGKIDGFEALARWGDDDLGIVTPDVFIPIAERFGLISELGQIILSKSADVAKDWPEDVRLSVNISPAEFSNPDLVESIIQHISEYGLDPNKLELEIIESSIFADESNALQLLKRIKEKGIKIAIDDFGTGYSSLSFLQRYPVDRIKIDKSFIADMETNRDSAQIVSSIISLSKNLNIEVVAEGIETRSQMECLANQECSSIQGFWVGRPMGAGSIRDYLIKRRDDLSEAA